MTKEEALKQLKFTLDMYSKNPEEQKKLLDSANKSFFDFDSFLTPLSQYSPAENPHDLILRELVKDKYLAPYENGNYKYMLYNNSITARKLAIHIKEKYPDFNYKYAFEQICFFNKCSEATWRTYFTKNI